MTSISGAAGFSLPEILIACALIGIISAIAVPTMNNTVDQMRLGQSARDVERELQTARQRAVGKSRVIRVRFNCPAAGMFRIVELIGTPAAPAAADSAGNRCSETTYGFPASDNDPITRPNLDGPVRRLPEGVTFGAAQTLEFWPDGTAHRDTGGNPWGVIPLAGVNVTIARQGKTATISVNGLGKIGLQTQ